MESSNERPPAIAKITRPRLNQPLPRPRLFDRLDGMRDAPVSWIVGPPGAGKTTLTSSYLSERGLACLWLQLDAGDGDAATFFHWLGLAIAAAATRPWGALPALTPDRACGLADFTRRTVQAMAARLALPAAIVLDDYDRIAADAALHEILRELATSLPEGLRLIVLSRADPPAACARLRLNQALQVLAGAELALTADEALWLAASRAGDICRTDAAQHTQRLLQQTGGWVAGHVLLLAQTADIDAPGSTSPSPQSRQLLFDYFAHELFCRFSPRTQQTLLRTALLPTLSAADAVSLSGDPGAGAVLAELHRQGCFCSRRGPLPGVYELHALFRAFLLHQAATLIEADEWQALQCRAADLLSASGQADAAAALYGATRQWSGLVALALREAPTLIAAGRHRTLEQWLADVPDEWLLASPWLSYWRAVARLPFDAVAARALFGLAYQGMRSSGDAAGLYSAWAGAMETFFYEWRDFTPADGWIAEFEDLRARHPEYPSRAIERRTYWAMGTLLHRQPQHPLLAAWSQRAPALLERDDLDLSVLLAGFLVIWFLWRGRTADARAVIDRVAPWTGPEMSPMVFILWSCAVGLFHSVQGDGGRCRAAVEPGLDVARRSGLRNFDFLLCAQMARCALVAGDTAAAQSWIDTMAGSMRCHSHIDGAFHRHLQCHAAAQRGEWRLALQQARDALAMSGECGVPFLHAHCHLDLARALLQCPGDEDWRPHRAAAEEIGRAIGSPVLEVLCHEIDALAALRDGAPQAAAAPLARAFAVSQAMGGSTWQLAGPSAAAPLHALALARGIEVDHVRSMIRRRGLAAPDPAAAPDNWPWPVRVVTLGSFEIRCDDELLRWSGKAQRKPLELLKCLCAHGGRAVPQDRLGDALWPDAEGDAAEQALRTTLHRLRKLLRCDAAVRIEDRHLSLDETHVWADCLAFERLARRLPDSDIAGLQSAVSRYKGPFLDGESAPWAQECAGRLRSHFIALVERLCQRLESRGDVAGAASSYLRAIEIEPGVEGFYRGLMHQYGRLGRRSEALAVYQRCRQSMLSRLGTGPALETQALGRQLAGG